MIDIYALLKNIAKLVGKSTQIVKIVESFEDNFQNDFARIELDKTYSNARKSVYRQRDEEFYGELGIEKD